MRILMLSAILCTLLSHLTLAAKKEDNPLAPMIYHGTVIRQIGGCEVDNICSVEVKTDEAGVMNFIWAPPDGGCRVDMKVSRIAEKLKPNDRVEIHTHGKTNYLCGDDAAVILLSK